LIVAVPNVEDVGLDPVFDQVVQRMLESTGMQLIVEVDSQHDGLVIVVYKMSRHDYHRDVHGPTFYQRGAGLGSFSTA